MKIFGFYTHASRASKKKKIGDKKLRFVHVQIQLIKL